MLLLKLTPGGINIIAGDLQGSAMKSDRNIRDQICFLKLKIFSSVWKQVKIIVRIVEDVNFFKAY